MSDLDEAKAILAARVAELDARFKGRPGLPMAYFDLKGGGRAMYDVWGIGGIKPQGQPHELRDTPVAAAKAWVKMTRIFDDPELLGILYWRRPVEIGYSGTREQVRSEPDGEWVTAEWTEGWYVNGRFVIVDGEPDLELKDIEGFPNDIPAGWAEMVAKYLEGVPK